jgi:prepilin-type processing-associated H-X9-DG protein
MSSDDIRTSDDTTLPKNDGRFLLECGLFGEPSTDKCPEYIKMKVLFVFLSCLRERFFLRGHIFGIQSILQKKMSLFRPNCSRENEKHYVTRAKNIIHVGFRRLNTHAGKINVAFCDSTLRPKKPTSSILRLNTQAKKNN